MMVFLGIYRALYNYVPTGDGELAFKEGDLLFVIEKGDDDWWKAKKKAESDDEDEPEGLIPANYVEKATSLGAAKALYDYVRQTDEELSFSEDASLEVYDASDPDWTLVGAKEEYGFAPSNYIEMTEIPPPMPGRPQQHDEPEPLGSSTPSPSPSPVSNPTAALAGIIQQRTGAGDVATRRAISPPRTVNLLSNRPQFTPEESDEEEPAPRLPQRPPSEGISPAARARGVTFQDPVSPVAVSTIVPSATRNRHHMNTPEDIEEPVRSPGGYHIYNIYEMVEVLGKSKKMPVTLGINVAKGIIMISAEKERSSKEWSADKLTHYSIEGKHVFMELVRPSKSIDFHAGAKDTAQEIVSALGDLASAVRVEGLQEEFTAATGTQKKGKMIYEFMAQGDDEVTVAEGDEVVVLDDEKSDEWWMVRRIKNGKEGVVPSNYVDIIGTVPLPASAIINKSYVEQNRLEEQRLARQATKKKRDPESAPSTSEVGPGLQLPKRNSSLMAPTDEAGRRSSQKDKRKSRDTKADKKSLPNSAKCRTWTDRSGSFKVEAEFIGLRDEKIHLHKLNGVKIAVPVPKMSVEDLEYVEQETGISLDELKPLSDIKRKTSRRAPPSSSGAKIERKPEYDWFDFFLQCGVDPNICERYAQSFTRDQIGPETMDDITPQLLRTLGLKEGDNLRVMKFLDSKFNRTRQAGNNEAHNGSLFSGPGGALKNNTAKGRPGLPSETKNELDANLLKQANSSNGDDFRSTSAINASASQRKTTNGFDDDAWEPRGSKTIKSSPPPTSEPAVLAPLVQPTITSGMAEMSLLTQPLLPTPALEPDHALPAKTPQQPTGATPSLFEQLAKAKQRPALPSQMLSENPLIAPPSNRSSSAPQNPNQASAFQAPPLQPQLTGYNQQHSLRMQAAAAPPGQSMQDLAQQRIYQQQTTGLHNHPAGLQGNPAFDQLQQNGLLPQQTGFIGQIGQGHYGGFLQAQPTGFQPQPTGYHNVLTGQQNDSPFADPPRAPFQPQPTVFGPQGYTPLQPQPTGVNSYLPAALQPQATGVHANQLNNQSFSLPPMPPIPPMSAQPQLPQPLAPQKTGSAPPVRFGVGGARKLAPQPTGRKANLNNASAHNPFGF